MQNLMKHGKLLIIRLFLHVLHSHAYPTAASAATHSLKRRHRTGSFLRAFENFERTQTLPEITYDRVDFLDF
jgi:hypothetical protein